MRRLRAATLLLAWPAPTTSLHVARYHGSFSLQMRAMGVAASATGGSKLLPTVTDLSDPREWLEDVEGNEPLSWVLERNSHAERAIGEPSTKPIYKRILDVLDSTEKIPYIGRVLNGQYYNFWQDESHVRGIWRRCTLDEYRKDEPAWETVLDVDALGAEEGVSWVWGGSTLLNEGPDVPKERVLISLSRGGADATIAREFDLERKVFVPPSEGGFELPEAKSRVCFRDRDTLIVGGVFGDDEMTDSGYPRSVYEWKRGTPLSAATKVYEGEQADVSVGGYAYLDRGFSYEMRSRAITFYTSRYEMRIADGSFTHVAVPEDANIGTFADQLLITLRSSWLGHSAGSMIAAPCAAFLSASDDAAREALLTVLFAPTPTCSLEVADETRNYLIISALDNVVSELRFWRYKDGNWALERSYREKGLASPSASAVNAESSDAVWVTTSGYTKPTTLSLADASSPEEQEPLKALPAFFDADGIHTQQLFATSADGTKVPYFLISREDTPLDGTTPTILYGYGGFEISLTPGYSAGVGAAWLEKGYAYVQANIRGGGEYGPEWHQAALKENRNKAYEDFEAVARDLVARGVCSHATLGCQGGSNGGLLTGNMLVRSPDLFGAIVCQV